MTVRLLPKSESFPVPIRSQDDVPLLDPRLLISGNFVTETQRFGPPGIPSSTSSRRGRRTVPAVTGNECRHGGWRGGGTSRDYSHVTPVLAYPLHGSPPIDFPPLCT